MLINHQSVIILQIRRTYDLLDKSPLNLFFQKQFNLAIMSKRFTRAAFARLEANMSKKQGQDDSSDAESLPEVNEEIICSICLEEVLTDYYWLPCRHCFHRSCIMDWKFKKPQCPNCRLVHHCDCFYIS